MYVPVTIFTDKSHKKTEITNDVTKHHQQNERSDSTRNKVQNCNLDLDKKI